MRKINLTILSFMAIILLSSCTDSVDNTNNNVLKVETVWESLEKWSETESIPTWFTNK